MPRERGETPHPHPLTEGVSYRGGMTSGFCSFFVLWLCIHIFVFIHYLSVSQPRISFAGALTEGRGSVKPHLPSEHGNGTQERIAWAPPVAWGVASTDGGAGPWKHPCRNPFHPPHRGRLVRDKTLRRAASLQSTHGNGARSGCPPMSPKEWPVLMAGKVP